MASRADYPAPAHASAPAPALALALVPRDSVVLKCWHILITLIYGVRGYLFKDRRVINKNLVVAQTRLVVVNVPIR